MKRIIATTAMALMLTTAAFAEANSSKMMTYQSAQANDIYASKLIGMRVYSAEKDYDTFDSETMVNDGAETQWDDLGEVNDVILGRDGKVKAVVLGIGGFVGIGEKDVAVQMDQIKFVNEKGDAGEYFLVVKTNKEQLTAEPEFDRTASTILPDTENTTASVTKTDAAERVDEDGRPMLRTPMATFDGYQKAEVEDLTAATLKGARVYGTNNEDVGEIDRLILDTNGKIKNAVLDIGGFLGLGEHPIAVTMDELTILREDDGDSVRVYIDGTQEELSKQPKYQG